MQVLRWGRTCAGKQAPYKAHAPRLRAAAASGRRCAVCCCPSVPMSGLSCPARPTGVCQDVVAVHPQNLLQEVRSPAQDRFTKVATTRSATATATARSAGGRDVSDGLNNIEFISLGMALCEACYVIAS